MHEGLLDISLQLFGVLQPAEQPNEPVGLLLKVFSYLRGNNQALEPAPTDPACEQLQGVAKTEIFALS